MTKLTPQLQDTFIAARKRGLSIKRCCELTGIDESLYYIWMKKGRDHKTKNIDDQFVKFFETINRSQAQALNELLERLDKATKKGSIPATIFRLQTQFKDEYPKEPDKVEVNHVGTAVFRVEIVPPREEPKKQEAAEPATETNNAA